MRTRHAAVRAVVGLVAVLAMAATACGSDDSDEPSAAGAGTTSGSAADAGAAPAGELDESVLAAARDEGKLVYYASQTEEITEALAKEFKEQYGITVESQRITSSNLIQRFSSEREAGVHAADAISVSTLTMYEDNPDWFTPFDETLLPNLAEYPAGAVGPNYVTTYSIGVGITYNSDIVAEEDVPKSWEDLLDPKFKGRIVLSDPRSAPLWLQWAELMRRQFGEAYLERLRDQGFDLVDSAAPGAQKVAAGAYAISFPASPVHSAELRSQGAPVVFVPLDDATLTTDVYLSIPKDGPNPNAARVWANWLLTPEAQRIACTAAEITSILPDIEGCVPLPPATDPSVIEVDTDPVVQGELLDLLGVSR